MDLAGVSSRHSKHSISAIYSGLEEVVVMANVHPSAHMNIEKLTRAMDDDG
jgi:hypothetical protein